MWWCERVRKGRDMDDLERIARTANAIQCAVHRCTLELT